MDESWGQNPSLRRVIFFSPSPSRLAEYLSLSDEEERVGKRIEAEGCRSLIKEKREKNPLALNTATFSPLLFSRQRAIINAVLSSSSSLRRGKKSWGKRKGEKSNRDSIEFARIDDDDDAGNNSIYRSCVIINVFTLARITVGERGEGEFGVNGIYANRGDFKLRFL